MKQIKFDEMTGLVPVIIQDNITKKVLMLGYMNQEAFDQTIESKFVYFYSRSKQRLWMKGETSGNKLQVVNMKLDCDEDTLLISVNPLGPTCHQGTDTCWAEKNKQSFGFLSILEKIIKQRIEDADPKSYVYSLFDKGINKMAQKVGEEAFELVIEAKDNNLDLFKAEAADLLFHYLILLKAKGLGLKEIVEILEERNSG